MRISHSRVELYSLCGQKYKFKYVEKLEANKTYTPLLFGSAIDRALNYVLTRTKHGHTLSEEVALALFHNSMKQWSGQNELVYYKNECPDMHGDAPFGSLDDEQQQYAVWANLCDVGEAILSTYQKEIVPLFAEILSVQSKKIVPNEDGDELVLITDFMARLHDGRVVVFDNKTTGDVKKSYPKTSVAKSQQLAIYTEFEETNLAGYIALQKKLKDGKVVWAMIIDGVPEAMTAQAFDKIDEALRGIKRGEFEKNLKACFSFGRLCEYKKYCQYGDDTGLVRK